MLDLQWDKEILNQCEIVLNEWDTRNNSFYETCSKMVKKVDLAEKEHLRNCVNFWKKRLENES